MSKKYRHTTKISAKYHWILFFLFPIASLFIAIRNFHIKEYRKFIWLFGILYGLTFMPIKGSDSSRYVERFESMNSYTLNEYVYDITHFRSTDSLYPDIYAYSLFFGVVNFTKNPQIFHMVTALVYFFVLIVLFGSVYDYVKSINPKPIIWFFLGLVLILNFSAGINGVRWPLSLLVFLYGTFKLIISENKKYLFLAGLAVLIHFAMIYGVLFLIIYQLFYKRLRVKYIYIFIIISILSSSFLTDSVLNNLSFFGESIEAKASNYITNENFKEGRELHRIERWNWYVQLNSMSFFYFGIFALFLVSLTKKWLFQDWIAKKMEFIVFLMLGASLMSGALVDSMSNRYELIFNGLIMIYLFYLSSLNSDNDILKWLSYILVPFIILKGLVILRGDLSTVSPILLFGNPIVMLLYQAEQSIQSYLPF